MSKLNIARTVFVAALMTLSGGAAAPPAAAETIRVVVSHKDAWDSSFTELGDQQGFFKEQGIELQLRYVDPRGLDQALASGQADIAVAAYFPDILAAYAKGAPVRIISPEATGAADVFLYAKIAGPISGARDLKGKTVGYSHPGSRSELVIRTMLHEANADDAVLLPIGAASNGMIQVIGSQLDASWATPPTALEDLLSGEIRIIARGGDSPTLRRETVRVNVSNARFLTTHRDAVVAFMQAYKKSVEWAYSGAPAIAAYAKLANLPVEMAAFAVREFSSKSFNQIDDVEGEEQALFDAFKSQRIERPLGHDDIKGIYDFVLK